MVQVHPIPEQIELDRYYSGEYFSRRTDRGYNNYYSESMKKELHRVWRLNLEDLDLWNWLTHTVYTEGMDSKTTPHSLDIGCAAGYFVDFMNLLDWKATGIEIAPDPIEFGRKKMGLDIIQGNFLEWDFESTNQYDFITLWASIEHMRDPLAMIRKIRNHLKPTGRLAISTCRYGIQARWKKTKWRYLNVPEHLFYFGLDNFRHIMKEEGFCNTGFVTYGSGMTSVPNPNFYFRSKKKILDRLVKWTNQGDMMALSFKKE